VLTYVLHLSQLPAHFQNWFSARKWPFANEKRLLAALCSLTGVTDASKRLSLVEGETVFLYLKRLRKKPVQGCRERI